MLPRVGWWRGFGLQPFIVTLAMMVFARGLAKFISGGQKISQAVMTPDGSGYEYVELPPVFDFIDSRILVIRCGWSP